MPQSCYFVVESLFIDALIVCAGEVGVKLFVKSWSFLMYYSVYLVCDISQ